MLATPSDPITEKQQTILTPEAVRFLVKLSHAFEPRRRQLLAARRALQQDLDAGWQPDFLSETAELRAAHWRVAPPPADLQDRRVEIVAPVDRRSVTGALNSGASVYVADFEDSTSPTWANLLAGQENLRDAVAGALDLQEIPAVLMVRPRGWHLVEKNFLVDGRPISASLFDFGLFFFHNARALLREGTGPYFYLPKLESRQEARLWNDVFRMAENDLGISRGSIRATALIENILAAFQMDEILWELREHSAGLNCGRWDYVLSYVSKFRSRPECILPDRAQLTMDRRFLASFAGLLVATCHRRGAHAIGSLAPYVPMPQAADENPFSMIRVREDKLREVWTGYDGAWVGHPAMVAQAKDVFDTYMPFPHQLDRSPHAPASAADLLCPPRGTITEEGVQKNLEVGLRYLAAWLEGDGCVAIDHFRENAATAGICRAQLWQWLRHGAVLEDGRPITRSLVRDSLDRVVDTIPGGEIVAPLYSSIIESDHFVDFLTSDLYDSLGQEFQS